MTGKLHVDNWDRPADDIHSMMLALHGTSCQFALGLALGQISEVEVAAFNSPGQTAAGLYNAFCRPH